MLDWKTISNMYQKGLMRRPEDVIPIMSLIWEDENWDFLRYMCDDKRLAPYWLFLLMVVNIIKLRPEGQRYDILFEKSTWLEDMEWNIRYGYYYHHKEEIWKEQGWRCLDDENENIIREYIKDYSDEWLDELCHTRFEDLSFTTKQLIVEVIDDGNVGWY